MARHRTPCSNTVWHVAIPRCSTSSPVLGSPASSSTRPRTQAGRRYLNTHSGIKRVRARGRDVVYRLPTAQKPPPRSYGPPLPIVAVTANVNGDNVRALMDGDVSSRWESGPQQGSEELIIDLGALRRTAAVVLLLGPYVHDFPQELLIEFSEDGQQWVQGWRRDGAGGAFLAAVRSPKAVPITFELGEDTDARFIRLRQLGRDPIYYWSVTEVAVLAPPPS